MESCILITSMSCYQCGSPKGTPARLCPECVANNQQRHAVRLNKRKETFAPKSPSDVSFLQSPLFTYLAAGIFLFLTFSMVSIVEINQHPTTEALLRASIFTTSIGAWLCWLYFWSRALFMHTFVAILALVFAFFIGLGSVLFYLSIWRSADLQTKILMVLMFGLAILSIVLQLSARTSFFELL